eukprot:UN23348
MKDEITELNEKLRDTVNAKSKQRNATTRYEPRRSLYDDVQLSIGLDPETRQQWVEEERDKAYENLETVHEEATSPPWSPKVEDYYIGSNKYDPEDETAVLDERIAQLGDQTWKIQGLALEENPTLASEPHNDILMLTKTESSISQQSKSTIAESDTTFSRNLT